VVAQGGGERESASIAARPGPLFIAHADEAGNRGLRGRFSAPGD
jgi:hypothetical protein